MFVLPSWYRAPVFLSNSKEMLTIATLGERFRQARQLFQVNEAQPVGNFLRARNLHTLATFNGFDKY